MKNSYETLPEGYEKAFSVDLQKDKKLFWLVNGVSALIAVVLTVLGGFFQNPLALFDGSFWTVEFRLISIIIGLILYIILHEAVHGIFIWWYSRKKPTFGLSLAYAYTGSEAYFAKMPYLVIALSPVVIWGLVLAAVCMLARASWFWVAYLIQVANLSGAAGDYYVSWRFCRLPEDILVQDTGVAMTVFSKKGVE